MGSEMCIRDSAYFKLPLDNHKNLVRWMTQDIEKNSWWIDTTVLEGFALPDVT